MELFYRKFGSGKPFIILHGLYGSSDNWVSIAKALPPDFEIWLIDLRNHGQSSHSNEHNYKAISIDLFEFSIQHQLKKFILLGHSMGGKAAMHFADSYPELLSHMIVIDIAPKSYLFSLALQSDTLNHKKIMEGMMALDFAGLKKREEIEIALSAQIKDEKIRHFLMKNIKLNQDMTFGWILNIESLYKNIDQILSGFKPTKKPSSENYSVLFVKGSESDYINDEDIQEIKSIYPNAVIKKIPNAAHWLHIEQPKLLVHSLIDFLS